MSDGHSNINRQNTIPDAIRLRQSGFVVLVFAIGTDVGMDELNGIASEPHNDTVFVVRSCSRLSTIRNGLKQAVADGKISMTLYPLQLGGSE